MEVKFRLSNTCKILNKIPIEILRTLDASEDEILFHFFELLSDEMLMQIASADYGYKAQECFEELKQLLITQKLPNQISFHLIECLELTRWIEPKNEMEHVIRAFSCMLLIILERKLNYGPVGEIKNILFPMIDSLFFLNLTLPAQKLLVWRILNDIQIEIQDYEMDEISIQPFLVYSLFLCMIENREALENLEILADWCIKTEMEDPEDSILELLKLIHINQNIKKTLTIEQQNFNIGNSFSKIYQTFKFL